MSYNTLQTLMAALITDRTNADVQYAATLIRRMADNAKHKRDVFYGFSAHDSAAWQNGLRGLYNASDLNRVEDAVTFLSALLADFGYNTITTPRGSKWTNSGIPGETDMARYLSNVKILRSTFYTLPDTPAPPQAMSRLTHADANDIERILFDIAYIIPFMTASFRQSGQFTAGEHVSHAGIRFTDIGRIADNLGRPLSSKSGDPLMIKITAALFLTDKHGYPLSDKNGNLLMTRT